MKVLSVYAMAIMFLLRSFSVVHGHGIIIFVFQIQMSPLN